MCAPMARKTALNPCCFRSQIVKSRPIAAVEFQLHAEAQDGIDLQPYELAGEAVFGNTKAQHSAGNGCASKTVTS